MSKYYHNDYKKIIGLDQTRTASEKLLDKAIGGIKPPPSALVQKPVEKKIKQQNLNLTHIDVLNKLIKNIQNNKSASKILKPLTILKKCLNDQAFITNGQINNGKQWLALMKMLMSAEDKLAGNYSEIALVIECLVQNLQTLMIMIKKLRAQNDPVKIQHKSVKQQQQLNKNEDMLQQYCQVGEIHLIYLKMFTDDSFIFNKYLSEIKNKYKQYYQLKSHQPADYKSAMYQYLQQLLIKMFTLPHTKYQWLRQSLSQFYKHFNITYKHLLKQSTLNQYLKIYNQFISTKATKISGESVDIMKNSSKGGKITLLEVTPADELDKWTHRQ